MEYQQSQKEDAKVLAEIRAVAMKPSLIEIGRYDSNRVRRRFLNNFKPDKTFKVLDDGVLVGFYMTTKHKDHFYLDHLYFKPEHQNKGLGKETLNHILDMARSIGLPIRLGALKSSRSNDFYLKNGFIKTHEDEYDNYYEYRLTNG